MGFISRIFAAIDFSEPSRTALAFGARLARQVGAELHVMHAEYPLLSAAASESGVDILKEDLAELKQFIDTTWPAAQCAPRVHVIAASAANAIVDAAERECAELIVVGGRGMSGVEHALLGSTTERVLRRAQTSVVVVPDMWKPAAPSSPDLEGEGPVIAAVDSRIPALEAAAAAARLAAALKTRLVLVHVVEALPVLDRWRAHAEAMQQSREASARHEIECLAKRLDPNVPVDVRIETGDVGHRVALVAQEYPNAMVVVGRSIRSHPHGPPGTNAYRIMTMARVPVFMHVTT